MLGLIESAMRKMQRLFHLAIPRGKSPASYRLCVRAMEKLLVYDRRTQTVTVRKGELRGAKKYGPFCEADFTFALGRLEPEIIAAFREHVRPGMTVFDIGANAGHHTLLLAKLCGVSGRVHAFEPVPETFRCLQKTILLNRFENVTLHQMAVSDRFGEAQFQTSGVFDNFACLAEGGHGRSEAPAGAKRTIPVSTTDLDSFCGAKGIARVDLIKMDIEGAEMLALVGMTRTLAIHRPVLLLELWGAEHVEEAPKLLSRLGYETHTLSVWEGWVDGVFARTANVMALPISGAAGVAGLLRKKRASAGDSLEAESFAGIAYTDAS